LPNLAYLPLNAHLTTSDPHFVCLFISLQRFSYKHVDGLDNVTGKFVGDYKKDDNDKDAARYVSGFALCALHALSYEILTCSCVVQSFFQSLFKCVLHETLDLTVHIFI